MQALAAARETLYQRARRDNETAADVGRNDAIDVPAGTRPDASPEPTVTYGQQQADALALLAETALHHGLDPGASAERYQVVVHVDAAVLANANARGQSIVEPGARVAAETSQRLACDASRVVMRHDEDGNIVEVGARTRTIPPALPRALEHRDQHCRFPGCGVRFAQGHHIRHWADGGPTTLSNLVLLCRRHHRAVHEEGFQVERRGDGEVIFWWPTGTSMAAVPTAPHVAGDLLEFGGAMEMN
jgi:5-methylcytosine-specific restriction endonuclease McrA